MCDLADAHVKSLAFLKNSNNKEVHVFNVGTGLGVSVLEIIHTFEEATGLKLNWKFGERRSGDVEQIYASCDKANDVLGWKHKYSIKEALIHSWNWEKSIRNID